MGEYQHRLDDKNRLILPAKFREELGQTFTVTKGLDGCLSVYTNSKWDKVCEALAKLPSTNRQARAYRRTILSRATTCELDNQGRIALPAYLKQEAGLVKDCVIVGVGEDIEIWAKDRWENYSDQCDESFEDIAESITDYLLNE